jgi:long chain fatty acid CoA FadD26
MSATASSISALLRERAQQRPDASYGLAEAMVYVASSAGRPWTAARFEYEKLSAGNAQRCGREQAGSELVSHGAPRACTVGIVDPETRVENPAGMVGEIWVHGDNVAARYWRNPQLNEQTFGARLTDPSPGTPQAPLLRTGDSGVMSDGKDVLIVDGRNHYPDDIEATVQEITGGRVAAMSVPGGGSEQIRRSTCAERYRHDEFTRLDIPA